ncbi:MAG: T9SS type A sorting domain-containing protein, partial [Saprospiraceae bacterium]|nr:T9SS type A sorting domain-containing protein [Saprospiraceae bacterium]
IDQDADLDVVLVNSKMEMILYYENPTWDEVVIASEMSNVVLGPLGDIDGDGDNDVSFGSAGGDIGWIENPGQGDLWEKHLIDDPSSQIRLITGMSDINGDTHTDLIATHFSSEFANGQALVYYNPTITSSRDASPNQSSGVTLFYNYPNPFHTNTTVFYQLTKSANVQVKIFNLLGQEIAILVDQKQIPGLQAVEWSGRNKGGENVDRGIYVCHIQVDQHVQGRKIIYMGY